jgi:hypothetical protein
VLHAAIDTTAAASYPPSAAQPWLSGRTCFYAAVACVSADDCDMNDTHLHPPESESSDAYRQQQREARRGPDVHRPPAVVVMSMPHQPSRATPSLNSAQKNNHRKGQQSSRLRRRCCKWQKPRPKPRKLQHDFCSHTPAFSPVCLILLACHLGWKFLRGKMR